MEQQKPDQSNQNDENYRYHRRHHRDTTSAIIGGTFLILLGILLFLASQGILAWDKWWPYLLIGLGLILLAESLIRYRQDSASGFRFGRLIAGIVLIVTGTAFMIGNFTWWPLIIIFIGMAIVIGGLLRSGKRTSK